MDIQKMMDAMSESWRAQRSNYHLKLGDLLEFLSVVDGNAIVRFDDENLGCPSSPHSYRGYYSDLAFEPSTDEIDVFNFRAAANGALGETFTGWNGGEFEMSHETPLWVSHQGSASGIAIMGIADCGDIVIIATKQID